MEIPAVTGEQSSAFVCNNQKCKELRIEVGDLKKIMKEKTAQLDVTKHTVEKLQTELKEATGDIAAARVEAEIYKADFLEERKDRERAQGLLIDLQQDAMQEEMKCLHTEIKDLKEERNAQRKQWARVSGKLKQDLDTSKVVIGNLKTQVEMVSSERDDLKLEVERRKESKHRKLKEYDGLKIQVKTSTALAVHLDGELEKARKDNKELLKFKKKVETKPIKVEKAGAKGSNCGSSNPQLRAEQLYEEEKDRNVLQSLQIEIELLKDEVEYQKSISFQFKKLVQKELVDDTPLSPEEDEILKSLTTDAARTDKVSFENDPLQQSQQQCNQQQGQPNAMLGARAGGQARPQQLHCYPQGNDWQGHPRTKEAAQHLQYGTQKHHHTYPQAQQFQEQQQQAQGLGRQNFPDNRALGPPGQQYSQPYSPQVEGQGYPQQPQRAGGVPPRAGGMPQCASGTNPNPVPHDQGTAVPPLQTAQGGEEHAMNQQGGRDLTSDPVST